jgi:ectoine hydroxylase-related dioxygenase (phytanoyl-CoA dioxygenase family)
MNISIDENYALEGLKRDGFYIAAKAIDDQIIADLKIKFDLIAKANQSSGVALGSSDVGDAVWIDHPFAIDRHVLKIASNELLASIVSKYLNVQVQLGYIFAYRTKILKHITEEVQNLLNPPGVFKGWHSDANLSTESRGYRCVVAMLYLTDVKAGDGGLWLVKNTHNFGGIKRNWSIDEIKKEDVIEITSSAGSIILFDMEMIHRAGTPTGSSHRDIIRFMYVPEYGYSTDYLIPMSYLDSDLSVEQKRIMGFGKLKNDPIKYKSPRKENMVSNTGFTKKLVTKILHHIARLANSYLSK